MQLLVIVLVKVYVTVLRRDGAEVFWRSDLTTTEQVGCEEQRTFLLDQPVDIEIGSLIITSKKKLKKKL